MQAHIEQYFAAIRTSYANFGTPSAIRDKMIVEFNDKLRVDEGNKYIKIVSNGSVHSFIVKEDGPKFKRGDILKAASWASPAKNFARGNIVAGLYANVSWTGA